MGRRLFWFVLGIFGGVYGTRYIKSKAKNAANQLTPSQVASDIYDGAVWLLNQAVEIVQNLRTDDTTVHQSNEGQVYISQE